MMAFNFKDRINDYFRDYDDLRINRIFNEIADLKKVSGQYDSSDFQNNLFKKNVELKKALESREMKMVIERNKDKLLDNEFFYISFSQIIVLFVIKHLKNSNDQILETAVNEGLKEIGFNQVEAISLATLFTSGQRRMRKSDVDQERMQKLFSRFALIRDKILAIKGKEILQNYGDCIRQYGTPFPSAETRKEIKLNGRWLAKIVDRYMQLCSDKYKYFVIECFKNPQELYYFREKYSYFYLIALSAPHDNRLRWTGVSKEEYYKVEKRERGLCDEDHVNSFDFIHLDVARCIDIADIAIVNNSNIDELFHKLLRYTALILEPGSLKPTESETLMQMAYTLSVKSNCLSRQVGAVITNADGYVIGAGWNDVGEGQLSCGIKMGQDYCNEYLKNDDIKIIPEEYKYYLCIKEKYKEGKQKKSLCPVLHAEENAILQIAMHGSGSIKDGTIYSTTVKLFVEQNIKSLKMNIFEGVKSYSYFKLFKSYYDKKELQKLF